MPFGMMARRLAASRLGVVATWVSVAGGPPREVRVLPSRPEASFGGQGVITGAQAAVTIAADALPGRPEVGDLISFAGLSHKVATVEQDARGTSFTLRLRRS